MQFYIDINDIKAEKRAHFIFFSSKVDFKTHDICVTFHIEGMYQKQSVNTNFKMIFA